MSAKSATRTKTLLYFALLLPVLVPLAIVFGVLVMPVVIVHAIPSRLRRKALIARFRSEYSAHGRFILFMYSDSPNWKQYIDDHILSRIGRYCIVLNWSERKMWKESNQWEPKLFRSLAPSTNFCPMAIVIPPEGEVREVRLHMAFLRFKHGKEDEWRARKEELFNLVERYAAEYCRRQ